MRIDYLNLKCPQCGHAQAYYPKDLQCDNNGPDDAPDYYVECIKCGAYIGNYETFQEWIPDGDYEPDLDMEYERQNNI